MEMYEIILKVLITMNSLKIDFTNFSKNIHADVRYVFRPSYSLLNFLI